MEYNYEFAGIHLCICGSESILYSDHGVLAPFVSTVHKEESTRISFDLVDQLSPEKGICVYRDTGLQIYHSDDAWVRYAGTVGSSHMLIKRQGTQSAVECLRTAYPGGISPKTVLNAMEAEHLVVQNGGVILHATYIRAGERAILFTAPSGTGKSTQADLWCRFRNAELLNGDRAAIITENGQVYACGIPFSGSSPVAKNAKLPLAAIVYLSQAPINTVTELKGFQAFRKIWEGCSVNVWDKEDVSRASESLLKILESVPVFHLSCTPDQAAVEALESVLIQGRYL